MATTRTFPPFPSPDLAPTLPVPGSPGATPHRARPAGGRTGRTATGGRAAHAREGEPRPAPAVVGDAWLASRVVVPPDRCGPPGMGNGGWVAGTVAGHLGRGTVEVTLVAPTPLGRPLELRAADDRASLADGDRLLATARRVGARPTPPPRVGWEAAVAAGRDVAGHAGPHPAPGCFVCGPAHPGGLHLFTGPVAGTTTPSGRPLVAAAHTPDPAHAGPDGRLGPAAVWALLDCPGYWVAHRPGMLALLGRLTARVTGEVRVGRRYVVAAALVGEDGRKLHSRVAVHDVDAGVPVAAAVATWLTVDGDPREDA